MKAPPKVPVKKKVKKKKTKKSLNFPGVTPPGPQVDFGLGYQKEFEQMQGHCYEELHRPDTVKIIGFSGAIYYVCRECLDKYMKDHEELKEVVIAFKR